MITFAQPESVMASDPNSLAAAVEIPAEEPANDQKMELSFVKGIQMVTNIFNSTPFGESLHDHIRTFCQNHMSEIPLESAITTCYRLAAVDLPQDAEFDLLPLEIEETIPLAESVRLSDVMREIKEYLCRFVVAAPDVIQVLAYYAAMTWFCRGLQVVPYLLITSGAPGSGKSTIAQAVTHLCYRGCMVSSASSTAALSRLCSQRPCTVMIDELDSAPPMFIQEVTSILNSGSSGSGDVARLIVERNARGRQQIAALKSFGPKILVGLNGPAGIRALQPATISRCITITTRGAGNVVPEPLPHFKQDKDAAKLRQKLAAVADQYGKSFLQTMKELRSLDRLPSRTRDKYLPLMTLATMASKELHIEDFVEVEQLWKHLQAAEIPEADIGRYLLSACGKILTEIVVPALKGLKSPNPPKHIQGMRLKPLSEIHAPCICSLIHEGVSVSNTGARKTEISELNILLRGDRKYVRSIELLAVLLLDEASPLQTASSGKPMTNVEFCQQLKAFGCEPTRITDARNVVPLPNLAGVMHQWLDVFEDDAELH